MQSCQIGTYVGGDDYSDVLTNIGGKAGFWGWSPKQFGAGAACIAPGRLTAIIIPENKCITSSVVQVQVFNGVSTDYRICSAKRHCYDDRCRIGDCTNS